MKIKEITERECCSDRAGDLVRIPCKVDGGNTYLLYCKHCGQVWNKKGTYNYDTMFTNHTYIKVNLFSRTATIETEVFDEVYKESVRVRTTKGVEWRAGYKVVRVSGVVSVKDYSKVSERYFSCYAAQINKELEEEYSYDKVTVPKKEFGPLTCFRTRHEAEEFANANPVRHSFEWVIKRCIFIQANEPIFKRDPGWVWPEGTIFANAIQLVKDDTTSNDGEKRI